MDREQDEAIDSDDPEGSLLDAAWGVIANASDWTATELTRSSREHKEWVEAAERWRDRYHEWLRNRHQNEEG